MSTHLEVTTSREAFVALENLAGRMPTPKREPAETFEPRSPFAPEEIVDFWRNVGPSMWFAKDPDFDRLFREHFLDAHNAAARGELKHWLTTATGSLAMILLLDQFPRNAFRGTRRMYETDRQARLTAIAATAASHDQAFDPELRLFFYLPFAHSEKLTDQDRCVGLCKQLTPHNLMKAEGHRDIIRRFGRFPHRNPILGRAMLPEEQHYLDEGGFAG